MNQMVLVLYSGTIQFWAERDLKLSALISPYLAKFMKHNKSTFLREIVIVFSLVYFSGATFLITSFNLMTEL